MADTLIFLRITDKDGNVVKGESKARQGDQKKRQMDDYFEQIEVESFSWGCVAQQSKKTGQKTSTQMQYEHLEVTKFFDRSTPALCRLMEGDGPTKPKPFKTAVLSLLDVVYGKDEGDTVGVPVVEITLSDGHVEELRITASPSGQSVQMRETLKLAFKEITLTYYRRGETRTIRGKGLDFRAQGASGKG